MKGAAQASMIVPQRIGQKKPFNTVTKRNRAPMYCIVTTTRRTKFVEYFPYAQTATKVIGTEQHENDIAQRFTGIDDLS